MKTAITPSSTPGDRSISHVPGDEYNDEISSISEQETPDMSTEE